MSNQKNSVFVEPSESEKDLFKIVLDGLSKYKNIDLNNLLTDEEKQSLLFNAILDYAESNLGSFSLGLYSIVISVIAVIISIVTSLISSASNPNGGIWVIAMLIYIVVCFFVISNYMGRQQRKIMAACMEKVVLDYLNNENHEVFENKNNISSIKEK